MNPRVYLAGAISGLSYDGATSWRDFAKAELEKSGIDAFSPMRAKEYLANEANLDATCRDYGSFCTMSTPRGIMTRDRFDATRCDVLLVNFLGATRVSIGTCMEIAFADAKRIPIVCAIESGASPASAEHLSWLSAMVDGEGCIYVVKRENKNSTSFELRVQIQMTDEDIVNEIAKRAGCGTVTGPYINKKNPHYRPSWRWSVCNQVASNLLRDMYPYIVLKKDQASAGISIEEINAEFRGGSIKDLKDARRKNPNKIAEQLSHYNNWKMAQSGSKLRLPAPVKFSNPHDHAMINEAIGFRVATLEEAIHITKSILTP